MTATHAHAGACWAGGAQRACCRRMWPAPLWQQQPRSCVAAAVGTTAAAAAAAAPVRSSAIVPLASSSGTNPSSVAETSRSAECGPCCSSGRQESSSGAPSGLALAVAMGAGLGAVLTLALPEAAAASGGGEALTGSALDFFTGFLDEVEALGQWGAVLFVVTVMLSEMIPLFPTQPLCLASGLLFGARDGSVLVLLGVTLAAINAFSISRGVGRPLAEKVIQYEMGAEGGGNGVSARLAEVQRTIKAGGFWRQFMAILLLRLTPVVPFSASNYVLGLTAVQPLAFVTGTLAGMSVWSVAYASLGGASRSLLDSGMDVGTLFAELAQQSGSYTKTVLVGTVGLAAAVGVVYGVRRAATSMLVTGSSASLSSQDPPAAMDDRDGGAEESAKRVRQREEASVRPK